MRHARIQHHTIGPFDEPMPTDEGAQATPHALSDEQLGDMMGQHATVEPAVEEYGWFGDKQHPRKR